jgi:flagellar FliL protein
VAEENENDQEADEKKGSPLKLIIIFVGVLVLIGGGLVGWLLLSAPSPDEAGLEAISTEEAAGETEDAMAQTFPLETFVVNLNDPGGKRYLKTNIELEYVDEPLGEELTRRLPQLRDLILLLLSSKSLEEIQSVDGKISLRRELILRINQTLTSGKIRNLYFTQFVIQ